MVDVATVNAVNTAAAAQSAAVTPATLDAVFGALLQAMTGDPSTSMSCAPIAASNTTAFPIARFATAAQIQITATPDSNFSATAPIASTIWTPAVSQLASATTLSGTTARIAQDNQNSKDTEADTPPSDSADTKGPDAATGLFSLWQLTPQAAPTMPAAAPQQTPQSMQQQDGTLPAPDAVTNSAAQALQTAPAASTIWSAAAVPAVQVRSTVAANTTDAPPDNTAPDNKVTAEGTATSNSTTTDTAPGLFALWQLQAAPTTAAPQPVPQQGSIASAVAAADAAAPVTAATAGSATANTPVNSGNTDPSATDPTAPDPTVTNQTATNQAVTNQTAPVAADPTTSAARDEMAALTAAQAVAAPRGTETGTADLKLKATPRSPDDAKQSGEKSKPVASEKTTTSDKTAADKTTGVTATDAAAGLKNSPIQPRQDSQTPNDQALNNSSPSATVTQTAPVSQQDGHAAAAKADAGSAQAVPASPLASEPPKVSADLQVAASHDGTDISATLDKLGVTIAAKSLQGLHQFDIRLDPADLGRVQVKLTVDDSGQAQASLVVDKPQTLDLLQRDSSSLNRVLTDAGLNLSNNGLNFSLRDQQQQTDGGTNKGRSRILSAKAALAADSSTIRSTSGSYAPNSVRLDIRV